MSKLYHFKRLITKYSVNITLVTEQQGNYIGGRYVAGNTAEITFKGAVVPMPDNKIYQSGGTLTTKDKQLITLIPISQPLDKANVKYKGNVYSIEQSTDFGDYADAYIYVLKWVSSFDKSGTSTNSNN